jgi:hypothetical protein
LVLALFSGSFGHTIIPGFDAVAFGIQALVNAVAFLVQARVDPIALDIQVVINSITFVFNMLG